MHYNNTVTWSPLVLVDQLLIRFMHMIVDSSLMPINKICETNSCQLTFHLQASSLQLELFETF